MRHVAFIELLDQIKQLTPEQRKRLFRHLMGRELASAPCVPLPLPLPAATGCPHCGASDDRLGSWGQSHGFKRYRCRDCGRTFNALTGNGIGAFAQARTMDALCGSLD